MHWMEEGIGQRYIEAVLKKFKEYSFSFPCFSKVIDKSSRFIFPIAFVIVNAIYGMVPTYSDESRGINIENYYENFKKL